MSGRIIVGFFLGISFLFGVTFPIVLEPATPTIGQSWQNSRHALMAKSRISIVQSTNSSLPHPIPLDQTPTKDEVEDMVRLAVNLQGGMNKYVSGCSLVVIKPNIVELAASGSGVVTDANVVRAIAVLIFEVNPDIRVVIGEASGGWCPDSNLSHHPDIPVADGFDQTGYRAILSDPVFSGKQIELVDLNLDSSTEVTVTPPYYARSSYFIPNTLLRANCIIDAPVMKVHITGITGALKNNIGVLPGLVYGWWKQVGYPYPSNTGLKHTRDLWDEEIVDISSVMKSKIKLTVVDAIVGREKYKGNKGLAKRSNTVVAGEDMVAVDWALAQLMGMNPDDIEHICLAAIKGLGVNDEKSIEIAGNSIAEAKTEYVKDPDADGTFGQSNRIWIFAGPYSNTDIDFDNLGGETSIWPEPGTASWTKPLYFFDDYINLATITPDSNKTVYAHTYFYSPRSGSAELWIGSDEDVKVFLNGIEVYRYNSSRTHALPNEIIPVTLQTGLNRLLVKAIQKKGPFDFCLNICEPDSRIEYHGNRVSGLKFYPDSSLTYVVDRLIPSPSFVYTGPTPSHNEIPFSIYSQGRSPVELTIVDIQGRQVVKHLWNDASPVIYWTWRPDKKQPAGIYFYRIQIGGPKEQASNGKIVLLK